MSREKLKIAAIAHDVVWADKDENIITVAELLNKVERDTDIVVLPEMFSTGTIFNIEQIHEFAENENGIVIVNVCRWAQFFKFAICGSFLANVDGKYYNRAFFVEPSGEITYYDKRHLFSIGAESENYNKGNNKSPIIRYRGWNISMQICCDIRFPIWCRNDGNKSDLMLVPANWPNKRNYAWKHLLIARAIENQMYVVGANRSGNDDYGNYDESSYIYDYMGKDIAKISNESSKIIYAELNKFALEQFRSSFPIYLDADKYDILI